MKLLKFLDDNFEMYICVALLSVMTTVLAVQVFMRYIMQASLSWSEELARYMFVWLVYLGISYGAKIMRHIKIEAALGLFPKKWRPYIVILGDVIFWGFAIFICYTGYTIVQKQMILGQTSPAIGMPMWFLYSAPVVGFALTTIRQTQTIIYRIRHFGQEEQFEEEVY